MSEDKRELPRYCVECEEELHYYDVGIGWCLNCGWMTEKAAMEWEG